MKAPNSNRNRKGRLRRAIRIALLGAALASATIAGAASADAPGTLAERACLEGWRFDCVFTPTEPAWDPTRALVISLQRPYLEGWRFDQVMTPTDPVFVPSRIELPFVEGWRFDYVLTPIW